MSAANAKCKMQNAKTWRRYVNSAFCILHFAFIAPAMSACPVCFGAPGPQTDGLNNAIIFLLIIVGLVQIGFVALFWSFYRRAKALQRHREQFRIIEGGV